MGGEIHTDREIKGCTRSVTLLDFTWLNIIYLGPWAAAQISSKKGSPYKLEASLICRQQRTVCLHPSKKTAQLLPAKDLVPWTSQRNAPHVAGWPRHSPGKARGATIKCQKDSQFRKVEMPRKKLSRVRESKPLVRNETRFRRRVVGSLTSQSQTDYTFHVSWISAE